MDSKANKFVFNTDFQWAILKYTLTDKNGFKAIDLYKPEYFDLTYQKVIADGIKNFYKKRKRIPDSISLGEEIRNLFKHRKYIELFQKADHKAIIRKTKSLCKTPVKEGETILDGCIKFASYIKLRNVLNGINIEDFEEYQTYSKKIQDAINVGIELKEDFGTFLIGGVKLRQRNRRNNENVFPTPVKQINKSTNGGGYTKGSVIVLVDKGKGGKTKVLINLAKGYLKMRKKVLYIDLENGEQNLTDRLDQSIIGKTKKDILSGEFDLALQKIYRRFKRMGSEILVKRLPSLTTTTDDIQKLMDWAYNEHGFKPDELFIDYVANMGCLAGIKNDDNARISNAYLDVKNLAEKNGIEHTWTGHHTVRAADKRRDTKYEPNDTAKCIDVHRHVDAMWGINQNNIEKTNSVFRMEVIDQRDGVPDWKCLFKDNTKFQRIEEFSQAEIDIYFSQLKNIEEKTKVPPKRKAVNDI